MKIESINLNAHTLTVEIPGSGTAPVFSFQNQGGFDVTGITSTNPSCTWAQIDSVFGSGSTPANLAGDIQMWYAKNCQLTATTQAVLTIGTQTTMTGSGYDFYDISGLDPNNPVDTTVTNGGGSSTCHAGGSCDIVGSQASPATPLSIGTVIQPTTSTGVVLTMMQVLSQNVYGFTSPSGSLFNPADQNNLWSNYYNPTPTALSYTVTTNNAGANGIQNWALRSVAFRAPRTPEDDLPFPPFGPSSADWIVTVFGLILGLSLGGAALRLIGDKNAHSISAAVRPDSSYQLVGRNVRPPASDALDQREAQTTHGNGQDSTHVNLANGPLRT